MKRNNHSFVVNKIFNSSVIIGIILSSLLLPTVTKAEDYIITDDLSSMKFGGYNFIIFEGANIVVDKNNAINTTSANVSNITQNSVVLTSTIISGSNITVRGFEYGTHLFYGSTTSITGNNLSGVLTKRINGLACGTTYYFRSFATNSAGTGYGKDQSFRTKNCGPRIEVMNLSNNSLATSSISTSTNYKQTLGNPSLNKIATPSPTYSVRPTPNLYPSPIYYIQTTPIPLVSPISSPVYTPTPYPTHSSIPSPTATPHNSPAPYITPLPTSTPTPIPTATPTVFYTPSPSPMTSPTPSPRPISNYSRNGTASSFDAFQEWLDSIFR